MDPIVIAIAIVGRDGDDQRGDDEGEQSETGR